MYSFLSVLYHNLYTPNIRPDFCRTIGVLPDLIVDGKMYN